ncbi:MAG: Sulfate adenylyltransferase subunit 1, partial [uncultured Solirubrobacterales bacterium]
GRRCRRQRAAHQHLRASGRDAALRHRRFGRRRQVDPDRAVALRHQAALRRPARGRRAHQRAARRRLRQPRPADRRPASRARAGHHHRRRLPVLRHAEAQVRDRRHAGTHPVHAQHGHRRLERRPVDRADRRAQGRRRAVAAPRLLVVAPADSTSRRGHQQDGPGRLRRGRLRADRRGVLELGLEARGARHHLHPRLRPARRQPGRALGQHAVVPGLLAALPPRARPHRLGPQPDRQPVPRAVGRAPDAGRAPRLPRLRGPGGERGVPARGRGRRAPLRAPDPHQADRHLRRAARGGVPAALGDHAARGPDRHLARRLHLPPAQPADRGTRVRGHGLLDGGPAADGGRALRDQAHEPRGPRDRRGGALPARREHAAPRRGGERTRPQRDRTAATADERAAASRRVPAQSGDRRVHPDRRGDERHGGRGDGAGDGGV